MEAKNKPQYRIIPQYVPEEYRSSDAPNAIPLYGYRYLHNTADGTFIIGEYLFGSNMQAEAYTEVIDGKKVHTSSILGCVKRRLKRAGTWIFRREGGLSEEDLSLLPIIVTRKKVDKERCGVKNLSKHFSSSDKASRLWAGIISRVKNPNQKCYENVVICDDWLIFDNFKTWYDLNYPKHLELQGIKLNLDKDLLSKGRLIYSPDTCVFIPHCVNSFLTNKKRNNTSGITGVYYVKSKDRWRADITDPRVQNKGGGKVAIGVFKTKEEAAEAYAKYRAEIAEYYKQYMRNLGYPEDIVEKIS
jgi:hypothetical protein